MTIIFTSTNIIPHFSKIARFCFTAAVPIFIFKAVINIVALISVFRFELDMDFLNFFAFVYTKVEKYEAGEAISILIEQADSFLDKENIQKTFDL